MPYAPAHQSPRRQKPVKVPPQDHRSADGRLMRRTREALARHCGGQPSATQAGLIDRAAWLTLYVARLDEKAIAGGGVHSDHDAKQYLAYSNSLTRTLRQLGLEGAIDKPPSPRQALERVYASSGTGTALASP
jgi:hypothetical protein